MPEEKSMLTKLTEAIKSTAGLITAIITLLSVLGYGVINIGTERVIPTCADGIRNGQEEKVDCGGNCPPCLKVPKPTCSDGVKNGSEEKVDCGGNCPPCPPPPPPPPPPTSDFTNLKHVNVKDGWLIKSIGSKGWNAGATSVKHLPAGVAGGVRYRVTKGDGHFLFGLTAQAGDEGYEQIQFALAVQPGSGKAQVNIFESGENPTKAKQEPYHGDEIAIHRSATGAITYTVKGKELAGFPPSNFRGRLLLDVSISDGNVHGLELFGGWR